MSIVQEVADKCKECVVVFLVTLGSVIAGNGPILKTKSEHIKSFLLSLSYVGLVFGVAEYYNSPPSLEVALAFAIGRWSHIIDNKLKEVFTNNTLFEIFDKIKGK